MSEPFSIDDILNEARNLRSTRSAYSFDKKEPLPAAKEPAPEPFFSVTPAPEETAAAFAPDAPETAEFAEKTTAQSHEPAQEPILPAAGELFTVVPDETVSVPPQQDGKAAVEPAAQPEENAPVFDPAPQMQTAPQTRERKPDLLTPEEILGHKQGEHNPAFSQENPNAFLDQFKAENPVTVAEEPKEEPLNAGDTIHAFVPLRKNPGAMAEGDTIHAAAAIPQPERDFFAGIVAHEKTEEEETLPGQQTLSGFTAERPDPELQLREDLAESRREKVRQFVLSDSLQTDPAEPQTGFSVQEETPDREDDYETFEDAKRIRSDLLLRIRTLRRSTLLTLLVTVVLTALSLLGSGDHLPDVLSPDGNPGAYLAVTGILFVCMVLLGATAIFGGLKSLVTLHPDLDSPLGLAGLLTAAQLVLFALFPEDFETHSVQLLCGAFGMALTLNHFGKFLLLRRIARNFRTVANKKEKYMVGMIRNEGDAIALSKGLFAGAPMISFDRRAVDLKHYLHYAYAGTPVDAVAEKSVWYLLPAAVLGAFAAAFFGKGSMTPGWIVSAVTAILLTASPFACILIGNAPLSRTARALSRHHGMLSGFEAAEEFADTDLIAIEDAGLFPKGTVQLCSVKTFGTRPVDDVLLAAAGVMLSAGGPLAPVFENIIAGRKELLPKVDTLVYEEKMGISGWVNGDRVLIGNRTLLENHGIRVPDPDVERAMREEHQQVVYLSAQGELSAAFLVRYYAEESAAIRLRAMVRRGMGLLVYGSDPNVTPELVADTFELPVEAVRVLSARERPVIRAYSTKSREGDALLVHGGTFYSYLMTLLACRRLRTAGRVASVTSAVCSVLGAVGAVVALYFGFGGMVVPALLWQLLSAFLGRVIPAAVRPD